MLFVINSQISPWAIAFSDMMSSARFSDSEDRHRQGGITRTNSSLDLDLGRARSELARAQDALLRDQVRERRHRMNLEDDDFDYHEFQSEIDEVEDLIRRRRRLIERGALTARHLDTDNPMMRPMRLLSDVPSSVPDSRRGTRSSALSQVGGSSVSSPHHQILDLTRFEEMERMLQASSRPVIRLRNAVVSRLSSEVLNDPGQENIVVYYYFDRSGGCKPYQAVSSLLPQILDQKDIPLPKFLGEIETDGSNVASRTGDRQPNDSIRLANLVSDFLSVLSRFKRVYICLDGLEECEDLIALMVILHRVSAVQETRLVLTARSRIVEQCIALGVGRKETAGQIENHNSSDIRQYLEEFVQCQQRICLSDMIGKEARSGLLDRIVEKSGGNFLSAIAQVAQLNRLTSLADVTDQLEKPPLQLSEVVDLILSRLSDQPPQRYRLAQRVFYWLSVARRPLTLRELQQAVAAEPGARIDDPNRLPPPSLITAVCMGFVHIDVNKNRVFAMPSAFPFYLYQFIGDFARKAREYAAISCLALLQSDILSRGPFTSQSQYDDMKQRLPFAIYVSQNWGIHLDDAGEDESMNEILENTSLLETLSQLLHVSSQPTSVSQQPCDNYPTGFGNRHFGAYFGLTIAFSKWPTQEEWAVARDSWNRSPFHVCFRSPGLCQRHVSFDLLEGENVSSLMFGDISSASQPESEDKVSENQDQDQAKPFRHEAVRGLPWKWGLDYDHIINAFRDSVPGKNLRKLFTFSRDEIRVADKDGKTPLHHFLVDWSEDTLIGLIQMTFDRDGPSEHREDDGGESNDDIADNSGRTTLDYACERSVLFGTLVFETAKWSLEQMNNGIAIAASCGYAVLVKYLSDKIDEKPNAKREEFELRLDGAAVHLRTPDPDAAGLSLRSPLHIAAREGHHDVVKLLVEEGFLIGARDGDGRTPLSYACEGGHIESVQVLLSKKRFAAVNSTDKDLRTPLSYAAAEGHVDVLAALVGQGGVGPNIEDVGGKTALVHAAERGHNYTVVVLIVLASNSYRVRATVMRSFEELYSRFSSKATGNIAVDVNMKDNQGRSAVFYLKRNGGQGASDVAQYIVELSEKPKPKTPIDGGEFRAEGGDGDRNKPAENPEERPMANDDQNAGQQPGAVDVSILQA
ncbi:hypothetical protein BKA56DRAFT_669000 [Ilyonectria sp. MPI-CAGE-AT-0026]|nr:hypothetical protein BKA56DRAFT_669000 [Ilyonectria sp. MPI-CAGE-AT-0026]